MNNEQLDDKKKSELKGDIKLQNKTTPDGVPSDLMVESMYDWDYYYTGDNGERRIKIPYVFDDSVTSSIRRAFQEAIEEYVSKDREVVFVNISKKLNNLCPH